MLEPGHPPVAVRYVHMGAAGQLLCAPFPVELAESIEPIVALYRQTGAVLARYSSYSGPFAKRGARRGRLDH